MKSEEIRNFGEEAQKVVPFFDSRRILLLAKYNGIVAQLSDEIGKGGTTRKKSGVFSSSTRVNLSVMMVFW